jgi:hypothetical protein
MNTYKKTARMVGAFYIAATAAGIVGLAFSDPIVGASDYLTKISANENQVLIGALFELIMAVAVAGIAIAVYPVLRQHNASIAIGYVGARIVESILFLIGVISLLLLVTLSHEFVKAGSPEGSYFHTIGELLLAVRDWGGHVVLDVAVFPLGALIFYSLLYQFRLVPRWVSGWGLIGAVLYWSAGVLVMFDLIETLSTPQIALQAPLGLQEIALALWLIVRGFNTSAIAAETVEA